jgi:hypothetical protein
MKIIYLNTVGALVAAAVLTNACASHAVRCHGPLQRINKPDALSRESKSAPKESRP